MIPSPIEIGGKMKWKLAVRPNWSRDRNSGFRLFPSGAVERTYVVASEANRRSVDTSNLLVHLACASTRVPLRAVPNRRQLPVNGC
jgi:hypothetical protein